MKVILTSVGAETRGLANRALRELLQRRRGADVEQTGSSTSFFCRRMTHLFGFSVFSHLVHDLDLRVKKTLVRATSPVETRGRTEGAGREGDEGERGRIKG